MNNNMKYDLDKLFADDPEMLKLLNEISPDDIEPSSVTQSTINTMLSSMPPAQTQPEVPAPNRFPTLDELLAELDIKRQPISEAPQRQPNSQIPFRTENAVPVRQAPPYRPLQTPPFEGAGVEQNAETSNTKPQGVGGKIGRIIFNALFYCLIAAILGGAAMFTFSGNTQKSYFGYRLYTVKTPSMTPQAGGPSGGFRVGDTILVKLCDPETVQPGDVITFTPGSDPNVYLTHRVEKVLNHLNEDQGLFFVTKGDANPSEDPPIAAKAVIGKVVAVIPGAGGIIEFVRSNFVLCLISIAAAIGSIILLRMYFSGPDKKVNNMARENQCSVTAT